ncbi:MAG: HAMP domain-containing histidine kinase, partial [Ramlibacter sp.]|nr:HAMP domain-containing histidine kinase [Ramlibacter sp.]
MIADLADWPATVLGAVTQWPASLRSLVAALLHSRQPMMLWWGARQIQVYNDAFARCFSGGRLPGAIGQPGADCWGDLWPEIEAQIAAVVRDQTASWHVDKLVPVRRGGRVEDVYWTYGFSPAYDDSLAVDGVLVTCIETTARVLSERRQALLARMAAAMTNSHTLAEIGRNAVAIASAAPGDFELALVCRLDNGGWVAHFAADDGDLDRVRAELTRRLDPALHVARETADVMPGTANRPTYARAVGPQQEGDRLCFAPVGRPPGVWNKVMVFWLNPGLPFDGPYLEFINHYLDMLMSALLRVDAAQMRQAAAIERDSLLLQAPVPAALLLGPEHRYRLANPPYLAMIGRGDVIGKTWREVFPELLDSGLPEILDQAWRSGQRYTSSATRVQLRRNGAQEVTESWFLIDLQPLRHSNGEVYGLMSVASDVTAQVVARQAMDRSHAERQALLEELESANRVKDEFLAMLGHELRNPLSPIVTALQLMKLRGDTSTSRERAVIQRQVDHLLRLVDDLLDVARITRGKIELKQARVDIAGVIARAVELASDLFEQRGHHLEIDSGPPGLVCEGDKTRLAQALSNLLTNAARYTPPGGHVWLSAGREAGSIVIRVRDDGIGIDAALLPRVFELFVQGARGIDRAEGGLGIGLALVRNLVELHGGHVSVSSAGAGRGSEFTLSLPAAPALGPQGAA